MVQFVGSELRVFDDLIDQINFEERFAADEIPYHLGFREEIPVLQNIIDGGLCHFERHAVPVVLVYQVAVCAAEVTLFGDNKGDAFGEFILGPIQLHSGERSLARFGHFIVPVRILRNYGVGPEKTRLFY